MTTPPPPAFPRGVHFMCWHRGQWNYHPSLPLKRVGMLDEVAAYGGRTLLWAALGSGGIGLPYLDREAHEPVPGRLRFYGHVNDREFCAEAARRGITVYGVLWNAQLWEFPAEFSADGSELLALNVPRDAGTPEWLGLRELSQDRYPALYRPMRDFLPGGLRDEDGREVTDYLEAFRQRSLGGADVLSWWLMAPGHAHRCYTPCSSNPAWRAYARRQIEMMLDAGAGGVLVDEPDAQLVGLRTAGGCFCASCVRGFRRYLAAHAPGALDALGVSGAEADGFDYGAFLRARGYDDAALARSFNERRWDVPLQRAYVAFVYSTIDRALGEYADHARAYAAATRGAPVPVSANIQNYGADRAALRRHLDFLSGERSGLTLRQDAWYRYAHAFQAGKPACLIEEPSTHVLEVAADLADGRPDAYALLMLEALAHGVEIAIPYGAWLINVVPDALYPDPRLERRLAAYLGEHAALFRGEPLADAALVVDLRARAEAAVYEEPERDREIFAAEHVAGQALCDAGVLYRVELADGGAPLTPERLRPYRALLLPECHALGADEVAAVGAWRAGGGDARVVGRPPAGLEALPRFTGPDDPAVVEWLGGPAPGGARPVARCRTPGVGLQLRQVDALSCALHLVDYGLDRATRRVAPRAEVVVDLGWAPRFHRAHTFHPDGRPPSVDAELVGRRLTVRGTGVHTVVHMSLW